MKKMLKRVKNETYYFVDGIRKGGVHDGLSGNVSGLSGNVDGLSGNVDGLSGNVSGLSGNVDECEIKDGESVYVSELVGE